MKHLSLLLWLLWSVAVAAAAAEPTAMDFVSVASEETLVASDATLDRYLFATARDNELLERRPDGSERRLRFPQVESVVSAWYVEGLGVFLQGRDAAGHGHFLMLPDGETEAADITPDGASPTLQTVGRVRRDGRSCILYRNEAVATAPLYALPLVDGAEPSLFYANEEKAISFAFNAEGSPVASLRWETDGSKSILDLRGPAPRVALHLPTENRLQLLGCAPTLGCVYVIHDSGKDAAALALLDLKSGKLRDLVSEEREDIAGLLAYPDGTIAGCCTLWEGMHYRPVLQLPALEAMEREVRARYGAGIELCPLAVAASGRRICARAQGADGRMMTLHYDYVKHRLVRMDKEVPLPAPARPVQFATYPAVDGTEIPVYYCLPEGEGPFPVVIFVHGGPRMRTDATYDWRVQFLVNRGFAVVQPQYRGSRGWGKAFMQAGDRQWGLGVMQTDVNDCVPWLVRQGIAKEGRVAILGGSYGGYAVTAGLCFTPELYACGISLMGPQDLPLMLSAYNGDTAAYAGEELQTVGDPSDPAELARLEAASPALHADRFQRPLLIYYGEKDTLVPPEHSRKLIRALQIAGKQVEVHSNPDEAHGFSNPAHEAALYELMVEFLRRHIIRIDD